MKATKFWRKQLQRFRYRPTVVLGYEAEWVSGFTYGMIDAFMRSGLPCTALTVGDKDYILVPFNLFPGPPAKRWHLELQFYRPLTKAEVRLLRELYPGYEDRDTTIGVDGIKSEHWYNKWPAPGDTVTVLTLLYRLGVPARVRAAPVGRDCPGGPACPEADIEDGRAHKCSLGGLGASDPVWSESDWHYYDPMAIRSPWRAFNGRTYKCS